VAWVDLSREAASRRSPSTVAVAAVLLMACSVSAYDYSIGRVGQPNRELLDDRLRVHLGIVHFDTAAPTPYRYRILPALTIHAMTLPVASVIGYARAFDIVSGVFYIAALVVLLFVLKRYLETWFSETHALIGTLATACTLPITLRQHIYAPWSWLEPSLLMLGLLAIIERRSALLLVLTIAASLNRETGVLVPVAFVVDTLYARDRSRRLTNALICLGVSFAILAGLRLVIGPGQPAITLSKIWAFNHSPEGLLKASVNGSLFLGITGWVLVAFGFRHAPVFVRRMTWLAAIYVPLYLVGGIWYEVRLLMPLYPVIVPSLLSAVYRPARGSAG
jgi:hypothetical protein